MSGYTPGPPPSPDPWQRLDAELVRLRRTAFIQLAIGVFGIVVGVGSFLNAMNSPEGGAIWTGGILVGAYFLYRSAKKFRLASAVRNEIVGR
jgi:uncharacterized membrane protein HdeD (DUF308 family)